MRPDQRFHLYLLAGQSNMAGRGDIEPQDTTMHPRVLVLDETDQWIPAIDPIHFDKPIAGVGPGLTFGKRMADHTPSARIGLIPGAAGGSPIAAWQRGSFWEQTYSRPYDDAIRRTRIAMRDGVLKGILWHQGESDSNAEDARHYLTKLMALVRSLRTELDAQNVPFVCATLAGFYVAKTPWASTINQALLQIPDRIVRAACVDTADLAHQGDEVHFDAPSARELGRRFGEAMIALQGDLEAEASQP